MDLRDLDKLFEDPANRPWGVFYHCSNDPRVIAPSRPSWRGYQINFAHPRAIHVLLLYLIVLVAPASIAFAAGPGDAEQLTVLVSAVFAASVAVLIALSAFLSRRHAV
jgi:hypothetical protein